MFSAGRLSVPETVTRAVEAAGVRHSWALDLDGEQRPVGAHLIVAVARERFGEVRVCACGRRYTAGTHPRGWWGSLAGELPLPDYDIRCGADLVAEWAERSKALLRL